MPANLRKLMQGVPRPFQIMAKEAKDEPNQIGQQSISRKEQIDRLGPLMGLIARGDMPLDATSAEAIQTYIDAMGPKL